MISKTEQQAIKTATSKLRHCLNTLGAERHLDEAFRDSHREEKLMRSVDRQRTYSRSFSVTLAGKYWAIKQFIELADGRRKLPELAHTLTMPRYTVIACQLFASYEPQIRSALSEITQEEMSALTALNYTSAVEVAA